MRDEAKNASVTIRFINLHPLIRTSKAVKARKSQRPLQRDEKARATVGDNLQAVTHDEARGHVDDDASIMDPALGEQYDQLRDSVNPEINLQLQRDDPFYDAIINHVQTENITKGSSTSVESSVSSR